MGRKLSLSVKAEQEKGSQVTSDIEFPRREKELLARKSSEA